MKLNQAIVECHTICNVCEEKKSLSMQMTFKIALQKKKDKLKKNAVSMNDAVN